MEHGKAALIESFLRHTVNHETLVIRRGVPKPSMCGKCKSFLQRIDTHLVNFHQITRNSSEFKRALVKCYNNTRSFITDFEQLKATSSDKSADFNFPKNTDSSKISTATNSTN